MRKPRRVARRASIDLGMLPSHGEAEQSQLPARRKSIHHVAPVVLPWSYDHNTDSSDDNLSIDCFDDPGEVVLVGVTGVSKRELMDAMFNATSATLDSSMTQLKYTYIANESGLTKPLMEPLLSLSDLCSTLMPPRVVADHANNDHINNGLHRGVYAPADSLATALSIDYRSAPGLPSLDPNEV